MKKPLPLLLTILLLIPTAMTAQSGYERVLFDSQTTYGNGATLTSEHTRLVLGNDRATNNYSMRYASCKAYCTELFGQQVMVENSETGVLEEKTRVVYVYGANNPKDGELDDNDKSTGNGYRPETQNLPHSGTYYMITPAEGGHITAFIILNAGKTFYVVKGSTGECLPLSDLTLKADGDTPSEVALNDNHTVDDKMTGTVEFDVVAGETYYLFGTGTKLSFGGYIFETVSNNEFISFADSTVESICLANWDDNGDGKLSYDEAAEVTSVDYVFTGSDITSFDEFQYFTGLRKIQGEAFKECEKLTSIIIPGNVTSIGAYTFYGCTNLNSVAMPNSVTSISLGAFQLLHQPGICHHTKQCDRDGL